MQLVPCDNCDLDKLLNELQTAGFIIRYQSGDARYIQVLNFAKHQHPHIKEPESTIQAPDYESIAMGASTGFLPHSIDIKSGACTSLAPCEHQSRTSLAPCEPGLLPITDSLKPITTLSGLPPDPPPPIKKTPNGAYATSSYLDDAENVLIYLNNAAGKDFKFRNPKGAITASAEAIINRLKEGYTAVQLREVVFFKAEEWRADEKMHTYLRPDTLFGKKKFEQYLGAIGSSDDRMS